MTEPLQDTKDDLLLKDQVYQSLKNDILLGRIKAGAELNMVALCKGMQISSAPLREAFNLLCKDGLILLNPRRKATVTEVSFDDKETMVYLRGMIEPYAARLSVNRIPQEKIDEMREILIRFIENPYDLQAYIDSDLSLHELLHQYAGSHTLSEVITTIKEHSIRMRYCTERYEEHNKALHIAQRRTSTIEHLEILSAIEQRDGDLVYSCVQQHILNFSRRLDETFGVK